MDAEKTPAFLLSDSIVSRSQNPGVFFLDDGRWTIGEGFLIADCGFLISKVFNPQFEISNPKFTIPIPRIPNPVFCDARSPNP